MPTAKDILDALTKVNGTVSLVTQVGEVVIPIVKIAAKDLKTALVGDTLTFQFVLQSGQADLQSDVQIAQSELDDINKRLAALGHPPITVSSAPTTGS
jgi:hypothetical protein